MKLQRTLAKQLRSKARRVIRRQVAFPAARREIALARVFSAFAVTSMGALSVGTLALGALAIRRLQVTSAHLGKLEIDELVVKSTQGLPIAFADKGGEVLPLPPMTQ